MLSESVQKLETENREMQEELKELREKLQEDREYPKDCEHCKYYLQHYIRVKGVYRETHCGHCIHGQCKKRVPNDKCKFFEKKEGSKGR